MLDKETEGNLKIIPFYFLIVTIPPILARIIASMIGWLPITSLKDVVTQVFVGCSGWAGFLYVLLKGMENQTIRAIGVKIGIIKSTAGEVALPYTERVRQEFDLRRRQRIHGDVRLIVSFLIFVASVLVGFSQINKLIKFPSYELAEGAPARLPNYANDFGCEWMGVYGQVFDLIDSPILNLTVHLEGELEGENISLDSLTGSAPSLGPGAYLFNIADHPIASQEALWIQVLSSTGRPISKKVFLNTSDSCEENFILINWMIRPESSSIERPPCYMLLGVD